MSRNTEQHFSMLATKDMRRSKFKRDCDHKTTFNTGDLIPFYIDEVLPGDTAKINTSAVVRMSTPIDPVMDNAFMDIYYFFVPRRLVWEHWQEFMGENTTDAWTQTTEYEIPQLTAPTGGWKKGSIASYIGARINTDGISIDACYSRAYTLIYNEWFRNQNVTEPAELTKGDQNTAGSNGTDYVTDLQKGGMPAKAVKYADYFTRALPEPQKGPDIYIPLGSSAPILFEGDSTLLPVTGYGGKSIGLTDGQSVGYPFIQSYGGTYPIETKQGTPPQVGTQQTDTHDGWAYRKAIGLTNIPSLSGVAANIAGYSDDLKADLSNAAGATINQLRQAFAVQRMYELDAVGGTRYIEILAAHFGVNSPDARMQRPEYLGGKRIPINMTQVLQTSSTDSTSPQGNTAAMSLTIDTHNDFTKSFTEHGILMGIAVIRTQHTYQQGINRILSKKSRTDFYWPALANIGEQYIKNKEIFAQGTEEDEEAFGYQEAWAEYRYGINRISGELNSDYETPLDSWHYGDDYDTLPTLSDEWIRETDVNVDRTLAIQTQDQFIADFHFDQTWIRPLPIYSIPSLTGWN